MKSRQDFKPDMTPPRSIEELVKESLSSQTTKTGEPYPVSDTSLDDLLQAIYAKIEREALATYHSSESWALRQWALTHILEDEVVDEATVEIADGLLSPVVDWQNEQPFNPIAYYKHRLVHTLRKKPDTVRAYMVTAARFVGKFGRKKHYSDDEVLEYLDWAGEHFKTKQSSYVCECQRLLQFLRNLPGANRQRMLPIDMPQMPDKFNQPMFSDEEVEKIAWACVLDRVKPSMVVRIAVASIYGGRKGELSQLSSDDIHLDGDNSYIYIATTKRGTKKRQPIPSSLAPIFSAPIQPITGPTLHNRLKKIVAKAEIPWEYGFGFHCFRRNVVTSLDNMGTQSDIAIHKFMRWSTPRHLGMLDRYRQTPTEVSDAVILRNHPKVAMWQDIIPYLVKYNPYYRSGIDILT